MKKILVVDDSALMRRVVCDIINSDKRFQVVAQAENGLEAFDLLSRNKYDAVVLDVNMPVMNGMQLLRELQKYKVSAKVMMASTDTREGAKTTLDALELGALDFVHKPNNAIDCKEESFKQDLLRTLAIVADSKTPVFETKEAVKPGRRAIDSVIELAKKRSNVAPGDRVVAIASSTGGPRALQSVIPELPADLDAPVLLVQHMPKGFTASLAERLDSLSKIKVKEAEQGEELQKGTVYVAQGGSHMKVQRMAGGRYRIVYSDEPNREGVKPCANYMYESLTDSKFDTVVCVVMTGMGADGTQGIQNLKKEKKVHVITQDQKSCTVYGMPKSVTTAGLSDQEVPLEELAKEIVLNVGVTAK